jgi:hypothetical protein
MPVEIETILQHEDVQILLEATEVSGTVRQSDINDLTEAHEFDVFELDLLYRELETRSVEIVDDTKEAEKAPPPPPPPPPTVESTTDALQLFLPRPAGTSCSRPRRRSSWRRDRAATCRRSST